MKVIPIPAFLHDVLGDSQSAGALALIAAFGTAVPALLFAMQPDLFSAIPLWRSALAILLIVDIAAGCIANFTPGTSAFYAARPLNRWIFIAIHVHIIAVALLLGTGITEAIAVWTYAMAGTVCVNALAGNRLQPVTGGFVLAAGLTGTTLWGTGSPALLVVMQLFLLKLVYAFAVDHYGDTAKGAA